ncbi:MAG: transposase [Archaeoglobus sp.]|nr:transposase [Archaeoglobus sp.]
MGTIDGLRSSRRIARAARENVVYMFLAGMLKPDFRTISDFRKNNADLISQVFKRVVEHARDAGLIKLGHVSIDGTKIRANASNEKYLTRDEVKLLEEILKEIKEGIRVDEEEDREYGESDGYEMDEKAMEKLRELRRKRKGRLEKMFKGDVDKLEEKIEKMKGSKASKVSITDSECRFMRLKGFEFCYNAQISIDSESGIIIARDVVNDNVDFFSSSPN